MRSEPHGCQQTFVIGNIEENLHTQQTNKVQKLFNFISISVGHKF